MPNELKTYDLVILGGGPAGIVGAATAKACRKTVALIDNHRELGGAGVNTGTVPSKTLRETALALSGLRARKLTGVDVALKRDVTVADFLHHEQQVRDGFNTMISQQLKAHKADVFCGTASFVNPNTVRVQARQAQATPGPASTGVGEVLLRGERFLIATGSSPVRPPLFPFGSPEIYDSDTILNLDRLPNRFAVIGAGVIGSEYACTFAALGAEVHLVDSRDCLLPFLDREVSHALAAAMHRNGVRFHWNEHATRCSPRGTAGIRLHLTSGTALTVDTVLVAAGRRSNTERLNLLAAGVHVGDRGLIPVDDRFRTNVPHIYAAGDVIGFPALASVSMEQARRAVRNALGLEARVGVSSLLPNGIYTIPEVSLVGETEEELKQRGVDYVVGRAKYKDNARGRIIGDSDGFLKLLFRREDMKLLGVHIMGEQATEIVHIGLMALLTDSTADVFIEACFNAPTLGGLYKSATIDATLRAAGSEASLTALTEA